MAFARRYEEEWARSPTAKFERQLIGYFQAADDADHGDLRQTVGRRSEAWRAWLRQRPFIFTETNCEWDSPKRDGSRNDQMTSSGNCLKVSGQRVMSGSSQGSINKLIHMEHVEGLAWWTTYMDPNESDLRRVQAPQFMVAAQEGGYGLTPVGRVRCASAYSSCDRCTQSVARVSRSNLSTDCCVNPLSC